MADGDPSIMNDAGEDASASDSDMHQIVQLSKYQDPEQHDGFWKQYLLFAGKVRYLVEGEPFNYFVLSVIVLAGFLVGVQTDPRMDPSIVLVCEEAVGDELLMFCKKEKYVAASNFFEILDFTILGIFGLECILKMVAEGLQPMRFFYNAEWRWNNFDFWVVVVCLPWGDILDADSGGTGSLRILRLARLMRLMKLIKKVPQLRMIVMGLLGGIKSIGYILLLLMLLFYIFAILGIQLFRDNDPYHFGDLHSAFFTLFRAATLEDWTEVMYANYFGCDIYPYTDYKGEHPSADNLIHPKNLYCHAYNKDKNAAPYFAAIYFPVFVLSCGLVTLSLFVATVTMSMTESMEAMKEEQEEADRQRRLAKAMKGQMQRANSVKIDDDVENLSSKRKDQDRMQGMLMNAWDGVDFTEMLGKQTEAKFKGSPLKLRYMKVAIKARSVAEHKVFNNIVIAAIMVASVLVGVETETGTTEAITAIDILIFAIFVLEFLVKVAAEGDEPWAYYYDSWNCFDFLIILGSVLDYGKVITQGGIVKVFRLARLLRVLKLLRSLPQLQVITSALMKGMNSILIIGVILMIFLYFFAIMGNIAFPSDTFHFGRIGWSVLTLWRAATGEDWTDLMYINLYGCDKFGYDMTNEEPCDYYNPQLIRNCCPCGNPDHPLNHQEGITSYYNPDQLIIPGANVTEHVTQYGSECSTGLLSVSFFVIFFVLGGLVLLTLFIGVVTTSMEEASAQQREEADVNERVLEICTAEGLTEDIITMYRHVFNMLDVDGGGSIEEDELKIGLQSIGKNPSTTELRKMMREVDDDDSGAIDFAEFVQFMLNLKQKKKSLRQAAKAVMAAQKLKASLSAREVENSQEGVGVTNDEKVMKISTRDQIENDNISEQSTGIVLGKLSPAAQHAGLNVPAAGESYLVVPLQDAKIHPSSLRKVNSISSNNKVVPEG